MKRYRCEFPGCEYETDERTQIHHHHILTKEAGGTDKDYNRIWLCPNHHSYVYASDARHGLHAVRCSNSIEIKGWLKSTGGDVLEYVDSDGNTKYWLRGIRT